MIEIKTKHVLENFKEENYLCKLDFSSLFINIIKNKRESLKENVNVVV